MRLNIPSMDEINPMEPFSGEVLAFVGLSLTWPSGNTIVFIKHPYKGLFPVGLSYYNGNREIIGLQAPKRLGRVILTVHEDTLIGWRFPGDF